MACIVMVKILDDRVKTRATSHTIGLPHGFKDLQIVSQIMTKLGERSNFMFKEKKNPKQIYGNYVKII